MADWTDGPEYAPRDRPEAFVAPQAAPLSEADAIAAPAGEPAPGAAPPPDYSVPADAPALAALVPPVADVRDPRESFDVAGSPLTSWSGGPKEADDHVHVRRPEDPFVTSAAPVASVAPPVTAWPPPAPVDQWPPPAPVAQQLEQWPPPQAAQAQGPYAPVPGGYPGAPGGQAPPPQQPWQAQQQRFRAVSVSDMLKASTPGVLICLAVGVLVQPLSAALLLVAWALSTRIRYRRRTLRTWFAIAAGGIVGLALFDMLSLTGEVNLFALPEFANGWAPLANLTLLVGIPLLVGQALRRGEEPEDRP